MPLPTLTYAFRPDKKIKTEFLRILGEIPACGEALVRQSRGPVDEAIHDGRLLIKRLRALLWFGRPALGDAAYERAKVRLRKAAGLMSTQRDLAVAQKTLDQLAKDASQTSDRAAVEQVFLAFVGGSPKGTTTETELRQALKKAMGMVSRCAAEIRRRAVSRGDWPEAEKRVRKAFRAAHAAERQARKIGGDPDFHEWRKKAKRLFYLLQLTQHDPGKRMTRLLKRIEKLQGNLGDTHDCVVVEQHLRESIEPTASVPPVLLMLADKKSALEKKAKKIARKLGKTLED